MLVIVKKFLPVAYNSSVSRSHTHLEKADSELNAAQDTYILANIIKKKENMKLVVAYRHSKHDNRSCLAAVIKCAREKVLTFSLQFAPSLFLGLPNSSLHSKAKASIVAMCFSMTSRNQPGRSP